MPLSEWRQIIEEEASRLGMSLEHYLSCLFPYSTLSRRFTDACLKDDAFRASVELTQEDLRDD